jgi:hypothetical protein
MSPLLWVSSAVLGLNVLLWAHLWIGEFLESDKWVLFLENIKTNHRLRKRLGSCPRVVSMYDGHYGCPYFKGHFGKHDW